MELDSNLDINEILKENNIAELLSNDDLAKISQYAIRGLEIDKASRAEWEDQSEKALEMAKQITREKNHPFPNASNVIYPLITKGAVDYAARTLPEVIQGDRLVKPAVVGRDPEEQKLRRGLRVSKHMSYQLLHQDEYWEDDTDSLLHVKAVVGTCYKKSMYNRLETKVESSLCLPDQIVVNDNITCLEKAPRITQIHYVDLNNIIEHIRVGHYLDIDIEKLKKKCSEDEDDLLEVIEQHCRLDLDQDGYKEPYIVTIHKDSGYVLEINKRFTKTDIKKKKDVIYRITGFDYFTDFHFIKSPDGKFHSLGLGHLVYPINAAINTVLNQLIDAGTLNNNQSGIISSGIRVRNGEFRTSMGEFKVLESPPLGKLQDNIMLMPTKEPSPTLFQLLGLLIDAGKDLSSINDVMQGKQPAQNVPATTILTLVEQGLKVFNAIHKRLFRSFKKEFKKVYALNRMYLDNEEYVDILDDLEADKDLDYSDKGFDLLPVMDPSKSSDAQRLAQAQALMQIPGLDPYVQKQEYLKALQLDEDMIEKLNPPPNPEAPPSPEVQKILAEVEKLRAEAQEILINVQLASEGNMLKAIGEQAKTKESEARTMESQARVHKMLRDADINDAKTVIAREKAVVEAQNAAAKSIIEQKKLQTESVLKAAEIRSKSDSKDNK